jgi:hypothetical protein
MEEMQKRMIILLVMALMLAPAAFAASWQQITTFTPLGSTGTEGYSTDPFNVPGSEWRVDWSYVPIAQTPGSTSTAFAVWVFPKGETGNAVAEIHQTGSDQTSGTSYIHQGRGDYYLMINVVNVQSYTVTVLYDADSVATQSIDLRLAAAAVIIAIVIIVAIIAIFKRRKK